MTGIGLLLLLAGAALAAAALPIWPHSRRWGYFPSALIGLAVLIMAMLSVTGRL
jgi:hypothetical protein